MAPTKLSPKMHQQQQMNGPKGSITHGTPLNAGGQQILIQTTNATTLSPRYDPMLRQTPPSGNDKIGSITQGTPIMIPGHHMNDKRAYDNYKNYTR